MYAFISSNDYTQTYLKGIVFATMHNLHALNKGLHRDELVSFGCCDGAAR